MRLLRLFSIACLAASLTACGGGGGGGDDDGREALAAQADFIHYANVDNIFLTLSRIEHPLLDGNPDAILVITQNLNPEGAFLRVPNLAPTGVQYIGSPGDGHWHIVNVDGTPIPPGASFNVSLFGTRPAERGLVHRVTAETRLPLLFSFLSNEARAPSDLLAFITQSPGFGGGAIINPGYVGVSRGLDTWAITNQAAVALPLDSAYHLALTPEDANTFVHEVTAGNRSGSRTTVRHPLIDDNPDAVMQATAAFAGPGSQPVDHPIAVQYDFLRGRWSVALQDGAEMLVGTRFIVQVRR